MIQLVATLIRKIIKTLISIMFWLVREVPNVADQLKDERIVYSNLIKASNNTPNSLLTTSDKGRSSYQGPAV